MLSSGLALAAAATILAGCGGGPLPSTEPGTPYSSMAGSTAGPSAAPSPTRPLPGSPLPATTRHGSLPPGTAPTGPPRGPSDQIKKTNLVVGTVTRGGSGPCYGLQTDDGTQYALYSAAGPTLTRGERVKVRTRPSRLRIDCGPGRFAEIAAIEP